MTKVKCRRTGSAVGRHNRENGITPATSLVPVQQDDGVVVVGTVDGGVDNLVDPPGTILGSVGRVLLEVTGGEAPRNLGQGAVGGGGLEGLEGVVTIESQTALVEARVLGGVLEGLKVEETVVGGPVVRLLVRAPVDTGLVELLGESGPLQGQAIKVGGDTAVALVVVQHNTAAAERGLAAGDVDGARLPVPAVGVGVGHDGGVVHVSERVRLGEGKVVGNVLAFIVAPGLRAVNDGPLVVGTKVHGLVRGDPVVGTGAEALRLVVALFGVLVVEPVRQEVVGLIRERVDGSKKLGGKES